ncbi:MAG: hypothetical protein J5629_08830 [Muribaculaceae bacterium]|nr:hypothetical protein [Muribaculaceae bacterium]
MKKLVLLFAVLFSVSMTSCFCGPQEQAHPESTASDSTSVVVEEANPSAPSVSEQPKEEVKEEAQADPVEEKTTEEIQETSK